MSQLARWELFAIDSAFLAELTAILTAGGNRGIPTLADTWLVLESLSQLPVSILSG